MSRTDKDMPWYAVTEYWVPEHYGCQDAYPGLFWWRRLGYRNRAIGVRDCDLPPEPVNKHFDRTARWRGHVERHCIWVPDWDSVPYSGGSWHRVHSHPPAWFVNHVAHAPERVNTRDRCLEAKKEYRANGEVDDVDIPSVTHSNCAAWCWY